MSVFEGELREISVPDISPEFRVVEITHGPRRYKLNQPIKVRLPANMDKTTKDTYDYIIQSLLDFCPSLIPFACESSSILELAKYLRRNQNSSKTLRNYIYGTSQFCRRLGKKPDELVAECKDNEGLTNQKALETHSRLIDDFVGNLTADKLAPCTIGSYVKGVKALYMANRLPLIVPRFRKRVKYEDKAPTQEELTKLVDIADLREKVIISFLAPGGFREETLSLLKYRHVKHDLERGIVPLHIHIESEITKGKYHSYDTFINREAVEYLKTYLEMRRRGSPKRSPDHLFREYERRVKDGENPKKVRDELRLRGIPPEEIHDESPLIRDEHSAIPKPVSPKQIYNTIHALYIKAGLITKSNRKRYELRVHSIRKFFRTQLRHLGMEVDDIEYMMGHGATYDRPLMNGIEGLRAEYAKANLTIRPVPQPSKIEQLKELARAWGVPPDEIRKAFSKPNRVDVFGDRIVTEEEQQVESLRRLLKDAMKKELLQMKEE